MEWLFAPFLGVSVSPWMAPPALPQNMREEWTILGLGRWPCTLYVHAARRVPGGSASVWPWVAEMMLMWQCWLTKAKKRAVFVWVVCAGVRLCETVASTRVLWSTLAALGRVALQSVACAPERAASARCALI